jgi:predicted HicB family RNase H-like nuclease
MSNKDLKYYQGLEYNVIIEKQITEDESWFIAYTNELGKFACYGRGESQVEALNNFLEEKANFIEYLFNHGKAIPEPLKQEPEKFSGIFNVRTSPTIHAKLVHQAKELDISLNLYLNQIITAAVEKKNDENLIMNKLTELCGKLDSHHFEITKQLRYQNESLSDKYEWAAEYSGPYLKTA